MTARPVKLTRKELYEKVWEAPLKKIAAEPGIPVWILTK
jgi:hypothetical protein